MTQQQFIILLDGVIICILMYQVYRLSNLVKQQRNSSITIDTPTGHPLRAQVYIAANLDQLDQAEELGLAEPELEVETEQVYIGPAFFESILWWNLATQGDERIIIVQCKEPDGAFSFVKTQALYRALMDRVPQTHLPQAPYKETD